MKSFRVCLIWIHVTRTHIRHHIYLCISMYAVCAIVSSIETGITHVFHLYVVIVSLVSITFPLVKVLCIQCWVDGWDYYLHTCGGGSSIFIPFILSHEYSSFNFFFARWICFLVFSFLLLFVIGFWEHLFFVLCPLYSFLFFRSKWILWKCFALRNWRKNKLETTRFSIGAFNPETRI